MVPEAVALGDEGYAGAISPPRLHPRVSTWKNIARHKRHQDYRCISSTACTSARKNDFGELCMCMEKGPGLVSRPPAAN